MAIEEVRDAFADTLDELREGQREVVGRYRLLVERLNRRMARELEPVRRRAEEVRQEIEARLASLDVDLPDYPEGDVSDDEDDTYLFDSSRRYFVQMRYYRRHQGKEADWDEVLGELYAQRDEPL